MNSAPASPSDSVIEPTCAAPVRGVMHRFFGNPADHVDDEVIGLLLTVMESMKDAFFAAAAAEDLSPPMAFALRMIDEPLPMREIANALGYDASNVTAIADKLEERNLAERRADPHDRRVKLLAVTSEGEAVRERMEQRLLKTVGAIGRLDADQRTQLRDLLRIAVGDEA